jgi:hypothetical protein
VQSLRFRQNQLRENFDRNFAVQARIAGAIHLPHAPRAHRRQDFILTKFRARGKGHVGAIIAPQIFAAAALNSRCLHLTDTLKTSGLSGDVVALMVTVPVFGPVV